MPASVWHRPEGAGDLQNFLSLIAAVDGCRPYGSKSASNRAPPITSVATTKARPRSGLEANGGFKGLVAMMVEHDLERRETHTARRAAA
jgi:hypothetical protein